MNLRRKARRAMATGSQRARAGVDRWIATRSVRRAEAAFAVPPARRFAAWGAGSVIVPPTRVERPGAMQIGAGVVVLEHSWLIAKDGPGVSLRIGDAVKVNRFAKIVALEGVTLGEGVVIGDHAYVSDVAYIPGEVSVAPADRALTQPAPVVIGAHASLGVGVVVKPGVTIGEWAYIGAGSVVERDVPERSLAVGNPARVVRRYDPERDTW